MRIVAVAKLAVVAFVLGGCPNAPNTDPTGGTSTSGEGGKGESTSSSGAGGKGGEGGKDAGAGGSNTGGNGSGGIGNTGGGAGNGGAAGNGSGGNGSGGNGTGGSSSVNCSEFLADVVAKQNSATGCNIELPQSKQCQEMVEGLCCPIAVTDMNSPEVLAYLQALQAYLNAGCMAMCPPDPCPQNPQQSCVAQMGSLGNCVVSP